MGLEEQKKKLKAYFSKDNRKQLTKWENDFALNVLKINYLLSDKQSDMVAKLVKKYSLQPKVIIERILVLPPMETYETNFITTRKYRKNLKLIKQESNKKNY
jgi:hydroxymethylpyrimidine/phosphomethylpyrimidine kinase